MKRCQKFIQDNINKNDIVIIGVSGGPDSMCLLDLFIKTIPKENIICAHINHNVREKSLEEEKFVRSYCLKNNIIYETTTFKEGLKKESELRKKRYNYFENLVKKYHAKYLVTAHHGDDLVETILMRLTRGSTLKGYAGIEIISEKKDYQIIRPLLFVTKKDIITYNKDNNIEYVIDESNLKDDYTRNRYRHHLLPFLKQENSAIHLKYLKYSQELLEYYNFVNNLVKDNLNKYYKNGIYNLEKFYNLDELIKRKIIEEILRTIYIDNLDLINDRHVNSILGLVNNKSNGTINLPANFIFEKSYDEIKIIKPEKETQNYDYILKDLLELNSGIIKKVSEEDSDNSNYCLKISSKEVSLPIHVRNRRDGDKIQVKNLKGTKKVKDILIDEKIPLNKRKDIIIVTDNENNILWIPGIKKSQLDKQENYDIIIKYISKKEEK